ncbi:MAG TPA: alpha/beta fold hydrolase [Hyphomicrobiaceae bacterium]|nr:alpha/beta fold hydrolase [Hyphomicrobiaceae bacterium]
MSTPMSSRITAENFRVPLSAGVEVFVRNKRPEGIERFPADRVAILIHGATYPGNSFDLQLGGRSWMDELAGCGFDTYALDLPGYGRSTRPAAMSEPPEANPPFMRTADAVEVLAHIVDFVRQRRNVQAVNLIGWSWGTSITASYAATFSDRVERLALFAPLWIRTTPSLIPGDGPLGAYRVVTRASAEQRRRAGLSIEKALELMPKETFDVWADATFATDPHEHGRTMRAPNGVLLDTKEYWSAGRAAYDPSRITCPTLLVVGEWDQDTPPYMAQTLFPLLVNARWRQLTMIGEATHSLLLEKNRHLLFGTVRQFLQGPAA